MPRFFEIRLDVTAHCSALPLAAGRVFDRFVVKAGEATHCCELRPSSFAAWVATFCEYAEGVDPMDERAVAPVWEWEAEARRYGEDAYFQFIAHDPTNPNHGPLFEAETWAEAEEAASCDPHFA
ncbi:MAG: hypothetical protein AAFN79_12310 [Pseudomonadota bacterium]